MKTSALFMLALLLMAGVVYAKDFEVKKKVGEYDMIVMIDKNPPITGDNNMAVRVRDAAGKDITDAKVKVEYSMPAMPGMPPMIYKADAALSGSEYRTKVNFPMSGSWNVVIKAARSGKTAAAKLTVDVR